MPSAAEQPSYEALRSERDLYRRLLDLGAHRELSALLRDALALIVEITGARLGYLELHDPEDAPEDRSRWSIAHDLSGTEIERVRTAISRGIIAQALASGETVITPAAMVDPRFSAFTSVREAQIEKVLCAPVGIDVPIGVLYLQGSTADGSFSDVDREHAEIFARHLAPLADRLLARSEERNDPTRTFRKTLRLDGVVGHSVALSEVLRNIALVAPLDVDVLLTGETGTGKSEVARAIHTNSARSAGPFVDVNCAALPDELLESELFGAMPGAHSTAARRIPGKVAAAEGGSLLLDEISELPIGCQAKLLQLLHSRQYYPLGSAQPVRADVRILAATNVDLRFAVSERRFREDLLYRLEVLPIRMPSLAQRRDDIPVLARHFATHACERHKFSSIGLAGSAVRAAQAAEWPGNVRQLAHAVEAAVIRAAGENSPTVQTAHLFPDQSNRTSAPEAATFQLATRQFQAELLRGALAESNWNIAEVARRLDITRSHVYNLIHAFCLARDT
ncbi:MAG: sigma-54-dependent Fis family transcriptional regulator [Deltaproteobacteria bacterium]|nr:MAG: sigma-54-dependent Fis family transcriptional regulator [Deltaproteobacteria bacterium]